MYVCMYSAWYVGAIAVGSCRCSRSQAGRCRSEAASLEGQKRIRMDFLAAKMSIVVVRMYGDDAADSDDYNEGSGRVGRTYPNVKEQPYIGPWSLIERQYRLVGRLGSLPGAISNCMVLWIRNKCRRPFKTHLLREQNHA